MLQWDNGKCEAAAKPKKDDDDDDDEDFAPESAAAPAAAPAESSASSEKRRRAGLQKLAALCELLSAHDFAWPFMEPVQPELQGLDRYDEVEHTHLPPRIKDTRPICIRAQHKMNKRKKKAAPL